ncbi:MAG: peptidylprolyl isomerase [Myxococcota bacterium]
MRVLALALILVACGGEEEASEAEESTEETSSEGEESEGEESEGEESEDELDEEAEADEESLDLDINAEEHALDEETTERVAPERRGIAHILVRYRGGDRTPSSVTRSKEDAEARAQEILERVNGGADFSDVASEMSDDEANKDHGGEMGTLERGLLPAPLDGALFEMEVGDVRGPIETPLGYHVVRRTE